MRRDTPQKRLVCVECKREPREDENALDEWRCYSDEIGEHAVLPEYAKREFGRKADYPVSAPPRTEILAAVRWRSLFGGRSYAGGRVRVYGCAPGCLLVSLAASIILTILINLLIRLF